MDERNDLIRELTEIAQDRHGAKNTHLLSWLEKGYFHCQHGSEEWCQGDYLDSARAYIERLEAVAKDALTTIATLSEALAEAEKKGAEDEGALAKAIFQADYPTDKWERFARGDVVDERYRLLARAALAHIFPPRDLSQGGQHG